jgi:hypothetical protein
MMIPLDYQPSSAPPPQRRWWVRFLRALMKPRSLMLDALEKPLLDGCTPRQRQDLWRMMNDDRDRRREERGDGERHG